MCSSSLEVIQRLETVDVGLGFWQRKERELGHGPFIIGIVRYELQTYQTCPNIRDIEDDTNLFDQKHSEEVVLLTRLMDGNSREPRH